MKEIMFPEEKTIRKLFIARAILWVICLGITAYWIWLSFHLYNIGIFDPYSYAQAFRPKFYLCLVITFILLVISFRLRKWSDKLKNIVEEKLRSREV